MPQASLRRNIMSFVGLVCLVTATCTLRAETAITQNSDPPCSTTAPTFDLTLFQTPIDATQHFTMQVYLMNSATPDNTNLTLLYYAIQGSNHYFNPTLVVPQGGTIDFTLQNCLDVYGRKYIAGLLTQGLAAPPGFVPGAFNVIQAPQPMPSGYINVHTHGLGGKPTPSTTSPTDPAGDEVLLTFIAPNIPAAAGAVSSSTLNQQAYKILVPSTDTCDPQKPGTQNCQDPGTYWYHPHLHGEAQPQVFLGLTGAIIVIPKGQSASSFDKSGLFIIRDYPSAVPNPPDLSTTIATSDKSAITSISSQPVPQIVHTRDLIYHHAIKSFSVTPAIPGARKLIVPLSDAPTAAAHAQPNILSAPSGMLPPAADVQLVPTPEIARCKLFLIAPRFDTALPDPCLPDQVTVAQNPATPTPPNLTTLVTVNGKVTETNRVDSNGSETKETLLFSPDTFTVKGTIRVLNASANTYLRVALHDGATISSNVPNLPPYPPVPDSSLGNRVLLRVTNRDGHPVGPTTPEAENTSSVLLPPGSRVEFVPASTPLGSLNLVSEPVDTGPAGDLVPFRTLAILNFRVLTPKLANDPYAIGEIDNQKSQRYLAVTRDIARARTGTPTSLAAHPHKINRRAFAFYEQARNCAPNVNDCGQSFYLIDITNSVYGDPTDNLKHAPVMTASPFVMPMHLDGSPSRELFGYNGKTLASYIPSVQVPLHNSTDEVDEDWDIYNFTAEDHAFHVHQLGFYIRDSCSPTYLNGQGLSPDCSTATAHKGDENKESGLLLDVINVPPAYALGPRDSEDPATHSLYPSKVSIRVPFTQDIVGSFVLHCHLLEHEDNGMMMGIQVWQGEIPDPTTPPAASSSTLPPGVTHNSSSSSSMKGMPMK